MKRQLAIRVQIFRGYDGGDNVDVFTGDWLTPNYSEDNTFDMNPTTSILNIKIDKQVNSPNQQCVLTMFPMRDADGNTWKERIELFDVVVVTARMSTKDTFDEEVIFFGFVTHIGSQINFAGKVNELTIVTCDMIGHLLTNPFMNFSKLTDSLSALFNADFTLWQKLSSINGNVGECLEKVLDYFDDYIDNIKIHTESGVSSLDEHLGYCVHSAAYCHPFYMTMPNMIQGMQNNFWNCITHVAEIYGNVGWMHEVIVDVMPKSRFEKFSELANKDSSLTGVTSTPTPLPLDTKEQHYLAIIVRPNTMPFIEPVSDAVYIKTSKGVHELDNEWSDYNLNSSCYQEIMSDPDGEFINYFDDEIINMQSGTGAHDIKTVFMLNMTIDQSQLLQYSVPAVVDMINYKRRGYDPLMTSTKYACALTSKDDAQAVDRVDAIKNLFKFNLRFACYNTLMDVMETGSFTIPFNMSIKIGDYFSIANLRLHQRYVGYVFRVSHNINMHGMCTTTVTFTRLMQEEQWENIQELFKERLAMCSTMNQRETLKQYSGMSRLVKEGYTSGVDNQQGGL